MEIFSHNTMTYRRPKQWWLRPFSWMGRCQGRDYREQYARGARYFDLRVRFTNGVPEFGHRIFRYDGRDFYEVLTWMMTYAKGVRLTLEHASSGRDVDAFKRLCRWLDDMPLAVYGGKCRNMDWKVLYEFKDSMPEVIAEYASDTAWCRWFPTLDDVIPWLYAKCHNNDVLDYYKDSDKIIMLDFI